MKIISKTQYKPESWDKYWDNSLCVDEKDLNDYDKLYDKMRRPIYFFINKMKIRIEFRYRYCVVFFHFKHFNKLRLHYLVVTLLNRETNI